MPCDYVAHSYVGLAPHPLPQPTDVLPWQRRQDQKEAHTREMQSKSAQHKEQMAEKKQKKGFLAGLDRAVSSVTHTVERVSSDVVHSGKHMIHDQFDDLAQRRFKDHFQGSTEPGEQLLGDFRCRVVNNAGAGNPTFFDGWMQVSSFRILFICSNRMNFYFPLTDLVSVQKASVHKTYDGGMLITPVPSERVIPQCIQLYTRQAAVHQFFAFHSVRQSKEVVVRDAHAVVEYAWRARVQVPNPAYQYLPIGAPVAHTYVPLAGHAAESDGVDHPAYSAPLEHPDAPPPPLGMQVPGAVGMMPQGYFQGREGAGVTPGQAPVQIGAAVTGAYPAGQHGKQPAPLPDMF